jgi:hypothetical protein
MGAFLAYNIKLSICFILFYLLYKLLLCRNTFYRTNRVVLLSAYLLMLLIPFIPIRTSQPVEIYNVLSKYELHLIQAFYMPVEMVSVKAEISWADIVVFVYLSGVLFFILRYIYFTIRIGLLVRSGEKSNLGNGIRLIIVEKEITPFSWLKNMLISRKDYAENSDSILKHELAHIRHQHSMDLLLAEIFVVIQWYNPAIWLIKNELKDIHEYEADDAVLHSGVNVKQYQLLLIAKAVGSQRFNSMTNSFNHSKLKKRITMMMRKKTSRWARLKYLTILPLAAFAVAIFARPEVSNKLNEISRVEVSNFPSIIEEKFEEISGLPEKTDKKEKSVSKPKVKEVSEDSVTIENIKNMQELFKLITKEQIKKFFVEKGTIFHIDSIFTNIKKVTLILEKFGGVNDSIFIQNFKHGIPFDTDFFSQFQNDSIKMEITVEKFEILSDSLLLKLPVNLNKMVLNDSIWLNMSDLRLTLGDSIRLKMSKEGNYFELMAKDDEFK